jgi:hypothetical protein
MEIVSSRYRVPTLERGNTIPNLRSPAMQRRNMSLYRGSKMCRKQVTLGNASVHTKMGVFIPPSNDEEEACRSRVSQFARSAAAEGNRVWINVPMRIFVGVFCGVGRRTGDRHVGQTG